MAQETSSVPSKVTGDTLTSAELNELNGTVNSNAADSESRLLTLESGQAGTAQGWGYYQDDAAAQIIGLTDTKLTIDGQGPNTNLSYLPSGVANLWDTVTNKVISTGVGDSYTLRLDLPVTAKDNNADYLRFKMDIGSGATPSITIVERIIGLPDVGELPTTVSIAFSYFSLSTFDANNAQFFLSSNAQTVTITNPTVAIFRTAGAVL